MRLPANVQWIQCDAETPPNAFERMLGGIKGIIFDFDGTIFDNANIALRLIGAYPPDARRLWMERQLRSNFSGRDHLTPEEYYMSFFNELGKACWRSPEKMRNWYFNRYMPRMIRVLKKHYKARPEFDRLLQKLNDKYCPVKTAIYSDYPFIKERMQALNLYASDQIYLYSPESFGAQKPAVRPFLQIAKDLKLQPGEILVIGDREDTDGLGAFNSGMHFFCLETGRKRHIRYDPGSISQNDKPQGPGLLMYAGYWDNLVKALINKVSPRNINQSPSAG